MEGALSLNGDMRTTMLGADYSRGPLMVGLSVGRTLGRGGYGGPRAGQVTTSMTGFYPWLGYRVNDRVSVSGVTGYGTGALSLTPDGAAALETGMSMAMTAAGTRGELIGSRATGVGAETAPGAERGDEIPPGERQTSGVHELPSVALTTRFLALCQEYGAERLAVSIVAAGRSTGVPGLPQSDDWTAWDADQMRAAVDYLERKRTGR